MRTRGWIGMIALSSLIVVACNGNVSGPADSTDSSEATQTDTWPAAEGDIFERVDPHAEGTEAYHGSLSSRYVLQEDGRFRLQYLSANYGFFEYLGSHSLVDTEIVLDFDASNMGGEWEATGTLQGDCLTVEYNMVMVLADFLDGEYCRPAGT